jgi:hypothetical protein
MFDWGSAAAVLETLADEGSEEDMRTKLKEMAAVTRRITDNTLSSKEIDAMDDIDLRRSLRSVAEYLQESKHEEKQKKTSTLDMRVLVFYAKGKLAIVLQDC